MTQHARQMATVCDQELKALEKELEQLEAEINPVLDDNAVVALCYLFGKSIEVMKGVDQVGVCLVNVQRKYYLIVISCVCVYMVLVLAIPPPCVCQEDP